MGLYQDYIKRLGYIRVIFGLYSGYIGVILGLYWVILGFHWDNRTSSGNYYLACLLELFGSEFIAWRVSELSALLQPQRLWDPNSQLLLSTWTLTVCKIMAFMAILGSLGLLFHILLGFR